MSFTLEFVDQRTAEETVLAALRNSVNTLATGWLRDVFAFTVKDLSRNTLDRALEDVAYKIHAIKTGDVTAFQYGSSWDTIDLPVWEEIKDLIVDEIEYRAYNT